MSLMQYDRYIRSIVYLVCSESTIFNWGSTTILRDFRGGMLCTYVSFFWVFDSSIFNSINLSSSEHGLYVINIHHKPGIEQAYHHIFKVFKLAINMNIDAL